MTGPTLRTARLNLRPVVEADAPAIVDALNVFDVAKWLTAPPYPYTHEDAVYFIKNVVPHEVIWAIEMDGRMIGSIGCKPDLGYWLDQRFHGQGIMSEAARAVVAWYFGHHDEDLVSGHFMGNIGSRTILRGLGFTDTHSEDVVPPATGQSVKLQRMKLTREQWLTACPLCIETDRLTLREFGPQDHPSLSRIGGDPTVAPMLMSVTSPWPISRVAGWVDAARYRGKPGFRAAITTHDATLIGAIGLGPARADGSASMMYFLDPSVWGQGYGTEAARGFVDYCFQTYPVRSLFAGYFDENPASGRVLRKLGFQVTGHVIGESAARQNPAPETLMTLPRAQWETDHG